MVPRVDPLRTVWKTQPHWLIADWLGFMYSRRTRGGWAPIRGSETLPHIYNSNQSGTKTVASVVEPPRTAWKPQPHRLIADWLEFVEPAPLEEDKVLSPNHKYFHT